MHRRNARALELPHGTPDVNATAESFFTVANDRNAHRIHDRRRARDRLGQGEQSHVRISAHAVKHAP